MISIFCAFFLSFLITILIIRTQKLHGSMSGDHDLNGPQKMHTRIVPRIGGLAIAAGVFTAVIVNYLEDRIGNQKLLLLLCSIPVFAIGLTEDFTKKISVRMRLAVTAISAVMVYYLLDARIDNLDLPLLDFLFAISAISLAFTIFAITGLANAYNIIDGFNGLSSMVGILTLLALGYMGFTLHDPTIMSLSLVMASAILGFFLLNYPAGMIFLGDGGAYLIGFWMASLSILFVNRHPEVSPWFALMVNAYPIWETLFTIYRRKIRQGKNPGAPDAIHFHSLIFRRILNRQVLAGESDWLSANAKTSPYLWVLCTLAIIPAILFWYSTPILIGSFLVFTVSYVWLYRRIVTFKTPGWMHPY